MAETKTYLNVPFAQKDAAKALGARWDPAVKKWYVPADKALEAFAQWSVVSEVGAAPTAVAKPQAASVRGQDHGAGVIVPAADKAFVAYQGDAPPWE